MAVIYMPMDARQQIIGQALSDGIQNAITHYDAQKRLNEYQRLTQLQQEGGYSDQEVDPYLLKTMIGNPLTERMLGPIMQSRAMGLRAQALQNQARYQNLKLDQGEKALKIKQEDVKAKNDIAKQNLALNVDKVGIAAQRANTEAARATAETSHNKAMEGIARDRLTVEKQNQGQLDPSDVDTIANAIVSTGQVPPGMAWGLSKGGNLRKVMHAVTAKLTAMHAPPGQLAQARMLFKATQDQVDKLSNRQGLIQAQVGLVTKTIPLLQQDLAKLSAATPGGRSQFPLANSAINAYLSGSGSPEMARYGFRLYTLANAYAKAINTTGQLTVEGQREAQAKLNAAQNPEQLMAVVKGMEQEIYNEEHGAEEQKVNTIQNFGKQVFNPNVQPSGTNAQYKSPDDVKAALKSGTLTRDQAKQILQMQFGFE